jgi:hypothetical protein
MWKHQKSGVLTVFQRNGSPPTHWLIIHRRADGRGIITFVGAQPSRSRTELPIRDVRCHGEYWGQSGLAADAARPCSTVTFCCPLPRCLEGSRRAGQLALLAQALAPTLEGLFGDHRAPVALHGGIVCRDNLGSEHPLRRASNWYRSYQLARTLRVENAAL